MIVAERKPFDEIRAMVAPFRRVLVLACGSCVTVCLTGGDKQAEELASQLRLAARRDGAAQEFDVDGITRQCDREFFDNLKKPLDQYDAVLSTACGVGVGFMADLFPGLPVLPALNTTFYGASTAPGTWEEYCQGCGNCLLALTGGICPMARCSKNLINGACGGTDQGKCEVKKEMECGWANIYKRLKERQRLDALKAIQPITDWRAERGAGVRRLTHAEMATLDDTTPEGDTGK